MKDTYTLKQAMERIGAKSTNAFFHMERKYPEAFVVVQKGMGYHYHRNILYDKATLDRFADRRDNFKKEQR